MESYITMLLIIDQDLIEPMDNLINSVIPYNLMLPLLVLILLMVVIDISYSQAKNNAVFAVTLHMDVEF